ncbi:hypothetical protein [Rhodococcus rhodnii]|uniref:Minor tail protein n=1 Tax=Rhodococcus rhodnii LMG 5362 TaxID=1273125 RepID=R7WVA6_9NOCA|nr:hypothetical protein [Rhodococcus rhodnii]EOM78084.1 hypothetical protein Rrhod_0534 [Rhodococcus rhodnii LMG 5362]
MTAPDGGFPDGALNALDGLAANLAKDEEDWKQQYRAPFQSKFEGSFWSRFVTHVLAGFTGGIAQVITNIVGAITQGTATTIIGLAEYMLGLKGQVEDTTTVVEGALQDISDITENMVTEVTTPIFDSLHGNDIPSFPRVLLQPVPTSSTASEYLGGHTHGIANPGTSSSTQSEQLGSHSHRITTEMPTYLPGNQVLDLTFIRVDRKMTIDRVKMITGHASGWFSTLDYWYIGLYVVDPTNNNQLDLVWASGDLKNTLSSQAMEYSFASTATEELLPGHLVAVAQLQRPGILSACRRIAAVPQVGIGQSGGEFPLAQCAYITGQSSMPASISESSIQYNYTMIPWVAVSKS